MRKKLAIVGAFAALAGSSAHAAPARVDTVSDLQRVARCLAEHAPQDIRRWVLSDGPMVMWREAANLTKKTGCTGQKGVEYWSFRGALAEALLLQDLQPGEEPRWSDAKAPTDLDTAFNWKNPEGRRSYLINVVAECVAQSNVKGTLSLLRTTVGTDAAVRAMAGLEQDIAACRTRSRGFDGKIAIDVFRARLALAAYELNDAVHGTASGTGK
jgi:hypothetical protein